MRTRGHRPRRARAGGELAPSHEFPALPASLPLGMQLSHFVKTQYQVFMKNGLLSLPKK